MLVRLTNGSLFSLENVAYVVQTQVNKWAIVPRQTVVPEIPTMDSHQLDELMATLREKGLLLDVKPLERPKGETTEDRKAANEAKDKGGKIEVAR